MLDVIKHYMHHPYPLLCRQSTVRGRQRKIFGAQYSSFDSYTWKHNEMRHILSCAEISKHW